MYGGFETCVEEISTRLAERGHEVTVYCRSDSKHGHAMQHRDVHLVNIPKVGNGRLASPYNSFAASVHAAFSDYDVWHFFGGGNVPFCLLGRLLRKKVILTVDGLEWNRMSFPRPARLYLRTLAELAAVFPSILVTDSKSCQEWYESRMKTKTTYIPYGTTTPGEIDETILARHGLRTYRYVLFTGRLVREKGVHTLIDAFKALDTDIELAIVGGYPGPSEYVDGLRSISGPRTRFLGYVYGEEFKSIMNGALAYVHPSLLDGTSISLLGALGAGLCIISSDIRENKDVAGDAAVYFEAGNSDDLKMKLQSVISDSSKIREMRSAASQRARDLYDWDRITDSYEGLYRSDHEPRQRTD